MLSRNYIYIAPLFLLIFCTPSTKKTKSAKKVDVGAIVFNEKTDDPNFLVCEENNIWEYYNFGGLRYAGDKPALKKEIFSGDEIKEEFEKNGYVTIRFIVNCKGETGRFRVIEMDEFYNEIKMDNYFIKELLKRVKNLNKWKVGNYEGKAKDYYQYLTFKISKGEIEAILP